MEKAIEVEVLDLSGIDPTMTHVLINVNIGRMPPARASKYLKDTQETLPLCKMLNEQGISYSLVGCRSDGQLEIGVNVEYTGDNNSTQKSTGFNFNSAMEIVES